MLELLAFISVNLLGAISPGPDFAIVTRYGLTGSRRAALLATLGITAALLVHVLYCIFGVAWFLQSSPRLFRGIQCLGGCYLAYLGIQMLLSQNKEDSTQQHPQNSKAFKVGFLTNLLNPKATLFLLSLFSQFITPNTSLGMKIGFGISIPLVAICWFSFLSFVITHPSFLPYLQRYQRKFTLLMGCFLLFLASSVFWTLIRSL